MFLVQVIFGACDIIPRKLIKYATEFLSKNHVAYYTPFKISIKNSVSFNDISHWKKIKIASFSRILLLKHASRGNITFNDENSGHVRFEKKLNETQSPEGRLQLPLQ